MGFTSSMKEIIITKQIAFEIMKCEKTIEPSLSKNLNTKKLVLAQLHKVLYRKGRVYE